MKFSLKVKTKFSFFRLRGIYGTRINESNINCLKDYNFTEVYDQTRLKEKALVELNVLSDPRVKVYHLYGIALRQFKNVYYAFVPCTGHKVEIETNELKLQIDNARQINFRDYKPVGDFTDKQHSSVHWRLAKYIKDGMLI
ncbi:MAG: hypothetical protein IJ563_05275 [Selenomonadaceae bacterium]|nr:hypothetical protein [Selenomonadaceae bacterium]